jgi:hypothetical protein
VTFFRAVVIEGEALERRRLVGLKQSLRAGCAPKGSAIAWFRNPLNEAQGEKPFL